jgi:argininosuccinate lyase
VSLDARLWLRAEIERTQALTAAVIEALVRSGEQYAAAVVPGYTHLRRAQAVLWPHYLLAYCEMFFRDWERLEQTRRRVNLLPLGSGALAGSGFPFDRAAMAVELGFDGVTNNSMDVSGDRDWMLDYLYAASMIMLHLSRLAEDWILYSSDEFGWLELSDQVTSGSSLMPQKKNPDSLELIRGKSGRVVGALNSLLFTMKGLPMTYNRDMQEDKEELFEAVDQTCGSLEMMRQVVETAQLRPEPPARAADESWVVATDLAEALARNGTPFHQAHKIAGRLVLASVQSGKKPGDWTPEQLTAFAPEFTPDMAKLLRPEEGMKSREIKGGTGPGVVAAALKDARRRLAELRR